MNDLTTFENPKFGAVRTIMINEEPWFVGKDVASILGYANPSEAISDHVDDGDKLNSKTLLSCNGGELANDSLLSLGQRGGWLINEAGLYSLILGSKRPSAKEFKYWVTHDVIPSIRKHGLYATPDTIEKMLEDPDVLINALVALKEERAKRKKLEAENEVQRQAIEDFKPVQQYVNLILTSKDTLATTQIAADYDLSAKALNRILHEEGLQHNVNGQWVLYRKHMGKGLTSSETIHFTHRDGQQGTKIMTKWTQKGRLKIHEILESRGIFAVMDIENMP